MAAESPGGLQRPHHGAPGNGPRGPEEIKSNDVTGRIREGEAGIVVEMGRPGNGAYFRDMERVAMTMVPWSGRAAVGKDGKKGVGATRRVAPTKIRQGKKHDQRE
jgi:hypothetical protein